MEKWLGRIRGTIGMGLTWAAAWSAAGMVPVGGVLLSAIFTRAASLGSADALVIAPTFAVACAISASSSLALAGRAGKRELPGNRGDTAKADLADHEKRQLL